MSNYSTSILDRTISQWWLRCLMLLVPLVGIPALSLVLFPVPDLPQLNDVPPEILVKIFINFFYFPLVIIAQMVQAENPSILASAFLSVTWFLFLLSTIMFLFRKKVALFIVSCLTSAALIFALPYVIASNLFGS